ncbi:MAG: hypothetical protein WBB74_11920, partial [Gaiellaceae bacterium]
MRRLALVLAVGLAVTGGASAELVAPRVQDGSLTLAPGGTPLVAYVSGNSLQIATRTAPGRWRTERAGSVAAGSS